MVYFPVSTHCQLMSRHLSWVSIVSPNFDYQNTFLFFFLCDILTTNFLPLPLSITAVFPKHHLSLYNSQYVHVVHCYKIKSFWYLKNFQYIILNYLPTLGQHLGPSCTWKTQTQKSFQYSQTIFHFAALI